MLLFDGYGKARRMAYGTIAMMKQHFIQLLYSMSLTLYLYEGSYTLHTKTTVE